MKNKELTPGTTVWVVERNEEGCACGTDDECYASCEFDFYDKEV